MKSVHADLLRSSFLTSNKSKLVAATLVIGAFAAPLNVLAQEAQTKELPTVTVEAKQEDGEGYKPTKVSSPKYTSDLLNTSQSITVVPQEVIEDRGSTSLRDVLRNVSGITMSAGEGGVPAGDNFLIRGFSARTDMFIDGVRDIGGYYRDPFNLDQVEVVKGPSSAYSGRGSTGGSINEVSKTAVLDDFNKGSIALGTDQTRRVTADTNHTISGLEGAALRLNVMYHENEVAGRDLVDNERFGFAPTVSFGLGSETTLKVSYLHQQEDNMPDYGHPYFGGGVVPLDRDVFFGFVNRDYEETEVNVGTVELSHEFSESVSIRNLTRYGRTDRDSLVTPPRILSFPAGTVNREGKFRDTTDDIMVNQTDVTTLFKTGVLEHTLVTGVELGRETSRYRRMDYSTQVDSLFNPDPYSPYTGTITPSYTSDNSGESVAAYAFDTIKLNEQWEVNGGTRWERYESEYAATNGDDFDRTDHMTSWRGGVVYKPVQNGSIYFSYGTSFNPSAEALSLAVDTQNIAPETAETFELGTKWDLFEERLGLTAAVFRTTKENARTSAGRGAVTVNIGEQEVQGFELGANGKITDDWNVFAGYTFMDSEVKSSANPAEIGKEIGNVPENSFTLWSSYELPQGWEVGGGAVFVDDRWSGNDNTNQVDSFWRFDAMVGYEVTKNVDVQLNVFNIADEEYYDGAYPGHAIPAAGRSALLTTSFNF